MYISAGGSPVCEFLSTETFHDWGENVFRPKMVSFRSDEMRHSEKFRWVYIGWIIKDCRSFRAWLSWLFWNWFRPKGKWVFRPTTLAASPIFWVQGLYYILQFLRHSTLLLRLDDQIRFPQLKFSRNFVWLWRSYALLYGMYHKKLPMVSSTSKPIVHRLSLRCDILSYSTGSLTANSPSVRKPLSTHRSSPLMPYWVDKARCSPVYTGTDEWVRVVEGMRIVEPDGNSITSLRSYSIRWPLGVI